MGYCHKALRVLEPLHYAAFLLNPGTGYIPDLSDVIPSQEEWFKMELASVDYRVTHKCVKNQSRGFRPTWQSDDGIINNVIQLFNERLQIGAHVAKEDLSNDDEGDVNQLVTAIRFGPRPKLLTGEQTEEKYNELDKTAHMINAFRDCFKGYKPFIPRNKQHNELQKEKYDNNPRLFWCDSTYTSVLPQPLIEFAHYIFSIFAASASPERVFSSMKDLVRTRRSSITGANVDKRLTMRSLLPCKRKLEDCMLERGLKRSKLFKFSADKN